MSILSSLLNDKHVGKYTIHKINVSSMAGNSKCDFFTCDSNAVYVFELQVNNSTDVTTKKLNIPQKVVSYFDIRHEEFKAKYTQGSKNYEITYHQSDDTEYINVRCEQHKCVTSVDYKLLNIDIMSDIDNMPNVVEHASEVWDGLVYEEYTALLNMTPDDERNRHIIERNRHIISEEKLIGKQIINAKDLIVGKTYIMADKDGKKISFELNDKIQVLTDIPEYLEIEINATFFKCDEIISKIITMSTAEAEPNNPKDTDIFGEYYSSDVEEIECNFCFFCIYYS